MATASNAPAVADKAATPHNPTPTHNHRNFDWVDLVDLGGEVKALESELALLVVDTNFLTR